MVICQSEILLTASLYSTQLLYKMSGSDDNKKASDDGKKSDITLTFLIAGDDVSKIFKLTISKQERVDSLFPLIQERWPDRFTDPNGLALHKKSFDQPNHSLASDIRDNSGRVGDYMEPQRLISLYFPLQPVNNPFHQYDGDIGPVHIIIYY